MGGYGSGRPGWRGVIEGRRRLDIRKCRRWLQPGSTGSYSWHSDGEPFGSVAFSVSTDCCDLHLRYSAGDDDERREVRITIPITSSPCRYGGKRLYWLCPRCRRRCEVVVMASHALSWGCRKCFKLRYHCQGLSPAYRLQNRADKIWSRLERDSEMAIKPKGMRWRTFNRLCDQATAALSRNSDAWFIAGLRRLGFAGIDEALSELIGGPKDV